MSSSTVTYYRWIEAMRKRVATLTLTYKDMAQLEEISRSKKHKFQIPADYVRAAVICSNTLSGLR